ncbi:MAG: Mrp/NBP35 family ATP-binding protein [Bacteroidota bacterium]
MNQESILQALAAVNDPITGKPITKEGRIKDIKIQGNQVNFTLALPQVDAQIKSQLNFACIQAIQKEFPNADVNVHLSTFTPFAGIEDKALPQVKHIIAVASGKGGVGKSTVATNLALGLKQQGAKVGLIDADLYGPSIPTMLGLKGQRPKVQDHYGKPKIVPLYAYEMPVMSIGFIIEPEQAVVLRGPRLAAIIKQFFNDVLWPDLDYLVIDLPPGTGDVQLTLVQTVPVTGAVLVTTPQSVALDDAIKAMNMFLLPNVNVPILGVAENMSWFTPEELPDNKYFIFGQGGGEKLAQSSESVLLGQIPIVMSVREGGDQGRPVILDEGNIAGEALQQIAKGVVEQLNVRLATKDPTKRVEIKNF